MAEGQEGICVPSRYSRVDPWIISADTDAEIAFLTRIFDATETPGSRMQDADGRIGHVEVEIGESVIMMFDSHPGWPATPAHLRVYVDDVERILEHAVREGARAVTEPTTLAFGERVARLRDPQGHLWWIHEHVEDVDPSDLAVRFADPEAQKSMQYVQQTLVAELSNAG